MTSYLKTLSDELSQQQKAFQNAEPQEILEWATETYGQKLAVVTSFQPTGIVTLHMLQSIAPDTPVLTLDTGLLFPETYGLMDQIQERLKLRIIRVESELSLENQAQLYGDKLWERQPDYCCHLRKTRPLQKALVHYNAWITGLRRDQSSERANLPAISIDRQSGLIKIAPFINWTEDMIWTYINAYDLPYNALHDQNYPSIGCTHCTSPVLEGQDKRSGRWADRAKTECGIHVQLVNDNALNSESMSLK